MTHEPDPFHRITPDDPIDEREPPPPPADQHNDLLYVGRMAQAAPYVALACVILSVLTVLCCGGLLVVNYSFGH